MKLSAKNYAKALFDSLQDTSPKDQNRILDNFVKLLTENNHLRMFEEIESEYHKLELAQKGMRQAEVTTATPLSRQNEERIVDELNKLVKGKVELKKKVDKGIIGGVIVQVDDMLIDASVKKNLEQLKNDLSN